MNKTDQAIRERCLEILAADTSGTPKTEIQLVMRGYVQGMIDKGFVQHPFLRYSAWMMLIGFLAIHFINIIVAR